MTADQYRPVWKRVREQASLLPRCTKRKRRLARPPVKNSDAGTSKAEATKTCRPARRVPAAVYAFLAAEADECSIDLSRLLQFAAMGEIRLRKQMIEEIGGTRTKIVRMTLNKRQLKHIDSLMQECAPEMECPMWFAVAVALGKRVASPEATVLLTIKEERILLLVDCVWELAQYCPPKPPLLDRLEQACGAVRGRFEQNGFQPEDEMRGNWLVSTLVELEAEIMIAVSERAIEEVWQRLTMYIDELGMVTSKQRA